MKALLPRQGGRPRDFEPAEAIFGIRKNLPNGPDRVRRYSNGAWRRGQYRSRPASGEQLGYCLGGVELFHNWVRDGSGGHVSSQRTDLDPGAAQVGIDNLIGERDAHRVEIHTIRNRADVAVFNGAYEHKQIKDRPCEIADPNQSKNGEDPDRVTHDDQGNLPRVS